VQEVFWQAFSPTGPSPIATTKGSAVRRFPFHCRSEMVRSDSAYSGVIFTIDTETGFKDAVFITGAYGLGENVVQGR